MKRSQLKEVIKSILQKKLLENSEYGSKEQLATYIKNKSEQDEFDRVEIQVGNRPIEIVEFWIDSNKTFHISVEGSGLQEANQTNMFGAPSSQPTQTALPKDQSNDQKNQDQTEGMSDQDKRELADAQKQQQKLSNDRDRLKGAIQKLEEPVRRKVADASRKVADIEKKLGQVTTKIQNIQKKYSKV